MVQPANKLMPWEPGFFEQQAAEAAAFAGQVVSTVDKTVTSAVQSAIPVPIPVVPAPTTQVVLGQVLGHLQDIKSNLPPTKNRVALDVDTGQPVTMQTKVGPVTRWDRLKGAYKWLISGVGFLLVLLNQLLVFNDILPQSAANWINIAITFLTSVSVFLKANEHWVEGT